MLMDHHCSDHTFLLDIGGSGPPVLWGAGTNNQGQLGLNTETTTGTTTTTTTTTSTTGTVPPKPSSVHTWTRVPLPTSDTRVAQVSTGHAYSLLLTASGQLYSVGSNGYGQLGVGNSDTAQLGAWNKVYLPGSAEV